MTFAASASIVPSVGASDNRTSTNCGSASRAMLGQCVRSCETRASRRAALATMRMSPSAPRRSTCLRTCVTALTTAAVVSGDAAPAPRRETPSRATQSSARSWALASPVPSRNVARALIMPALTSASAAVSIWAAAVRQPSALARTPSSGLRDRSVVRMSTPRLVPDEKLATVRHTSSERALTPPPTPSPSSTASALSNAVVAATSTEPPPLTARANTPMRPRVIDAGAVGGSDASASASSMTAHSARETGPLVEASPPPINSSPRASAPPSAAIERRVLEPPSTAAPVTAASTLACTMPVEIGSNAHSLPMVPAARIGSAADGSLDSSCTSCAVWRCAVSDGPVRKSLATVKKPAATMAVRHAGLHVLALSSSSSALSTMAGRSDAKPANATTSCSASAPSSASHPSREDDSRCNASSAAAAVSMRADAPGPPAPTALLTRFASPRTAPTSTNAARFASAELTPSTVSDCMACESATATALSSGARSAPPSAPPSRMELIATRPPCSRTAVRLSGQPRMSDVSARTDHSRVASLPSVAASHSSMMPRAARVVSLISSGACERHKWNRQRAASTATSESPLVTAVMIVGSTPERATESDTGCRPKPAGPSPSPTTPSKAAAAAAVLAMARSEPIRADGVWSGCDPPTVNAFSTARHSVAMPPCFSMPATYAAAGSLLVAPG
mmetsp:Transcript_9594/g.33714  ORF Transcript_9594/g.33714 Transcript_9594/m.33714 type:complete len:681 (+) Transcript_9594:3955-5997(+)